MCVCVREGGGHTRLRRIKKEVPDFSSQTPSLPHIRLWFVKRERGEEKKKSLPKKHRSADVCERTHEPSFFYGRAGNFEYLLFPPRIGTGALAPCVPLFMGVSELVRFSLPPSRSLPLFFSRSFFLSFLFLSFFFPFVFFLN